ncbi:hypothetical protein Nocox_22165 [Nonomuraea coxensis DSM 45129]|uniref:FAD dependent oxidoreductase domain-containing protein n=1 Tax=Nonomuraea coxensis DSM 45129 TaxID=1122611 RepID=A0ABX8U2S1_9ACTN|nr:NAD(P)-binding protein [Nonomuraea coxensis]QYC42037.1 hypothetical protein Nocox_22165 [Nonomuraea coxensis DSM 45129]
MDVLVCGAGVAGAALAYWLRHHGLTPTVVERAPRARAGGCAAGLRGEALDLRLGDAAMADEYAARPVAVRAGDLEILRDDLAGLLYQATRREVEYVFGDSIATLEQTVGDVRVTFDRGRPRRSALAAAPEPGLRCTSPPGRWPTTAMTPGSTAGSRAGWCCSGTPGTVRRRPRVAAPPRR